MTPEQIREELDNMTTEKRAKLLMDLVQPDVFVHGLKKKIDTVGIPEEVYHYLTDVCVYYEDMLEERIKYLNESVKGIKSRLKQPTDTPSK